jgi:hypothetical protein
MNAQETLKAKLNPQRFPAMSDKMAALVGFVLGEEFTEPPVAELVVTSDNCVLARNKGDIGANAFIGGYDDVKSNFIRLLEVADLTPEETAEFDRLYSIAVGRKLH